MALENTPSNTGVSETHQNKKMKIDTDQPENNMLNSTNFEPKNLDISNQILSKNNIDLHTDPEIPKNIDSMENIDMRGITIAFDDQAGSDANETNQSFSERTADMERYDFYRKVLKSPKYIVAPMVDQSELAWRILSRRYGAQLCYTPMFHAKMFSDTSNRGYYNEMWKTNKFDRPLIVQFCANSPQSFVDAAKLVENEADAVDLNLGCPQHIAKRGKYGAFMMDEWKLIEEIITHACANLKIPVTAKIRIYSDISKTLEYAQMLVRAGAKLLTVHGRLREQKGHKTGLSDWEQIRLVRENLPQVPIISNGNILYFEDIENCIKYTKVDGVMSAETNLYNPALFSNKLKTNYEMATEYLQICKLVPTKISYIRAHLFKLFKPSLPKYVDLRTQLANSKSLEEMESTEEDQLDEYGYKILPHWYCQPAIRREFDSKKSVGEKPLGRSIVPISD
ncbi:hypothetical protein BB558_007286 [Smittium angustum]|uniref:tRNA-dihydrouridine(16/17) synthase [NAD(P)(+)] n=1 Tax=Smittium angustum TaxID=133377 RepID=A0A2U1IVH0_SMIAN|nr:hypothetical protein BB558_007286 [Smittium angustum]